MRATVRRLAFIILLPATASAADAQTQAASVKLTDVSVITESDATTVHIKTAGAVKYRAELIDAPNRLVIDFEDTVYGWRKAPLAVGKAPIRQIRGSQYRPRVARVVVDLTRKAAYAVREDAEGLTVVIPTAAADTAPGPGTEPKSVSPVAGTTPGAATPAAAGVPGPATPAMADAAGATAQGAEEPVPSARAAPKSGSKKSTSAAAKEPTQSGTQVAQATNGQSVGSTPANRRLISLDFKDADVVNLLRVLAAESGKNVVIGEDVKGKMSIALRNVPWEQALETILESRSLVRLERGSVMRIVTAEQLTKEREARARVEESKVKAEADVRAKVAEAALKEAEAQTRKLSAEAAQREAEARGPLREETVRLSYADPEAVAETLQGILGIPKEGQKIQGPGILGAPNPELYPYGPPPSGPAGQAPVISVSQDVLAKGLSIRAHKPTNTIFLRLYAADLERIKKLIRESLDIPLPQVKIEARMEILDRNALEQIGVQWGGMFAQRAGSQAIVGQGFQSTLSNGQTVPIIPGFVQGSQVIYDPTTTIGFNTPTGLNLINSTATTPPQIGGLPISFQTGLPLGGNLVNLPISALPNAGPLPAGGLSFGIVGTNFNINLALQALAEQGKTRTLARPEIVTVENAKATMSLGEEIPYATISSAGTQIQFKEALLKLEVTPTVIREGAETKIKMLVIVENNSRGTVVNLGSAGQPPAINRRKAETQVLIKEGDRLIIGGVTTAVNQNTTRKVPVFGDIPILGHLFKQRENFESGRELVVFLTPTIIMPPGAPGQVPGAPAAPAAPPATPAR